MANYRTPINRKKKPNSPISRKKDTNNKSNSLNKVYLWIILFLLLIGAIIFVLRQPFLQTKNIIVENNKTVESIELEKYSLDLLKNNQVFFVPRTNWLIFSDKWLEKNILADWPSIKELVIKKKNNSDELFLIINERLPDTLWCTYENEKENCFYVDVNGLVYDKAPLFSDGIFIKLFTEDKKYEIGQTVTNQHDLFLYKKTISELKESGISVVSLTVLDQDRLSLGLEKIAKTKIMTSTKIIILKSMSTEKIIERLGLVQKTPKFIENLEKNPANLEYIDLRFENSIVYKFKE